MSWTGDHRDRPAEVFTVIHASAAMQQEADVLASHAAVAWLDRDQRVSIGEVVNALCKATGTLPADASVRYHHPEAFLVRFNHQHHCAATVSQREVPLGPTGPSIVSKPHTWRLRVVDGEAEPRDRRERITRPIQRHGRDQDRDGDKGQERQDSRDGHRRNDSGDAVQQPLLCGSGSSSASPARASEHAVLTPSLPTRQQEAPQDRGRSLVRQASPRAGRRHSAKNLTSPTSPPLSPTSVLQPTLRSKCATAAASPAIDDNASPGLINMCSPTVMLRPLNSWSPQRPPGFEASPTPPLLSSGPLRRTHTLPRTHPTTASPEGLGVLFTPVQQPLLAAPVSPPAIPATARRKTLAGVAICNQGGISLRRTSARLSKSGRGRKPPIAK